MTGISKIRTWLFLALAALCLAAWSAPALAAKTKGIPGSRERAVEARGSGYSQHYSSSHALVVGIDKYRLWPQLEYAARDARSVAKLLRDHGFKVRLLLDGQATRGAISRALDDVARNMDRDSRFVFHFSGHGQTEDLPGGGSRGYLVPVEGDVYDWRGTMISMSALADKARELPAKHCLLMLDSCYSGLGLVRSGRPPAKKGDNAYVRRMMSLRSVQVLTAGGRADQAVESAGHGLFTEQVLAALDGAADINRDGFITVTEVFATVRPVVTARSFNRQTPQFGYLEGEGDLAFAITRSASMEPAIMEVWSPVDEVDVWVDKEQMARALPSSRPHQIQVAPGRRLVLVKKGNRTLHREFILFRPGRLHKVVVAAQAGEKPNAFAMVSISHPAIRGFAGTRPADLDGDGWEEMLVAQGKEIFCLDRSGKTVWQRSFSHNVGVNLTGSMNSRPVVGVSGMDGALVRLYLLDAEGRTVWESTREVTRHYQGKLDGGGHLAAVADLDGDGREEVLAYTSAGYAWKPRGVIVYDQRGRELWRYLIGPSPKGLTIWPKPDGTADLILGSYGPGNGNRESNGTDDVHSYLLSIDHQGRTNWIIETGTNFTGVQPLLADLDGDGQEELYAFSSAAYEYRPDRGAVYRLSREGRVLARFEQRDSILSLVASRQPGGGVLYASDKNGRIHILDKDLKRLGGRDFNRANLPMHIKMAGAHDYDGDGRNDLLLQSFNREQIGNNPRSDRGPRNKVFYYDMKFQVLSGDLTRVIKEVGIAEKWDQWRGFSLRELDRPDMSPYPFMALSDKITLFNF